MSFRSTNDQQPLFIYSYDPPSPTNPGEYDPPYPQEIMSPHCEKRSFHFTSVLEESTSDANYTASKDKEKDLESTLLSKDNYNKDDHNSNKDVNASPNKEKEVLSDSDNKQITPNRENKVQECVLQSQKEDSIMSSQISEAEDSIKINASDRANCEGDEITKNEATPLQQSLSMPEPVCQEALTNEKKYSKLISQESSSTVTGKEMSSQETSSDGARYTSPFSTSHSVSSFLSDTITMNMPYDSSDNEIFSLECDIETPKSGAPTDNAPYFPVLQRQQTQSTDSALASPSLTFSPVPTESCTITPLPHDFNTPDSTNPTSTPLPGSEVFLASESTPSTPSTVTTSDMQHVSKKLQQLSEMSAHYSEINSFIAPEFDLKAIENKNFNVAQLSSIFETRCNKEDKKNDREISDKRNCTFKKVNNDIGNICDQKVIPINEDFHLKECVINDQKQMTANLLTKQTIESGHETPDSLVLEISEDLDSTKKGPSTRNDSTPKIVPPLPPPRKNSLPPPLPPPPKEDCIEMAPPVPQLPIEMNVLYSNHQPPMPPQRQYLLISLTPGHQTPILFTAPSPPPRSASLSRNTSPMFSKPRTPVFDKTSPCIQVFINENVEYDHSIESASNGAYCPRAENGCFRTLTPVPEEMPSCNSPAGDEIPIKKETNIDLLKCVDESKKVDETLDTERLSGCNIKSLSPTDRPSLKRSSSPPLLPPKPSYLKLNNAAPLPPPKKSDIQFQSPIPNISLNFPGNGTATIDNSNMKKVTPKETNISALTNNMSHASTISMPIAPPLPIQAADKLTKSPLVSISSSGKLVIDRTDLPLPSPEEEIRKTMFNANAWNWISRSCETLAIYTQVKPNIQKGSQCGLVALSMASQVCPSTVSVEDLFTAAKERNFTNHGEMFSAVNLCSLANTLLDGVQATVKSSLLSDPSEFIQLLLDGDLILVPYDSDHSHMPGQYGGRKAHWALVCGCIVQSEAFSMRLDDQSFKPDLQMDNLWHYRPKSLSQVISRPNSAPLLSEEVSSINKQNRCARSVTPSLKAHTSLSQTEWKNKVSKLVILWRQGKSRHLIASPLDDLRKSNEQLFDYPESGDYIIDSISDGLCGKFVVLHKVKRGLSDLLCVLQESQSEH